MSERDDLELSDVRVELIIETSGTRRRNGRDGRPYHLPITN